VKPAALSISQATERGACYMPEEVRALGAAAREAGLAFHVDGARFANAVAALGCAPADLTWRAGVDLLSFGATKNGALAAEAIICFDPARAEEIARRRKRGGQLFSKGRYAAAQLLAYLEGDLWLKLASRANALAKRLGDAAAPFLSHPVETNQVFIKPGAAALAGLRAAGAEFYDWGGEGAGEARLVVSWNQSEADIEAMVAALTALR
jgi:threonine aldolase